MRITFIRFNRLASRCKETATTAGAAAVLVAVYQGASGPPLQSFMTTMVAVETTGDRYAKAVVDTERVLAEMDPLFRAARSVFLAFHPTAKVPDTLKSQPTDTDKRDALQGLFDKVHDRQGQTWADALLQGAFGLKAAPAIAQLDELIAAAKALQEAKAARAAAFGPAWEGYRSFKRVVRDTCGAASLDYRRLRIRSAASGDDEEEEEEEASPEAEEEDVPAEEADDDPPEGGGDPSPEPVTDTG